jgi:hypothetical protein
MWDGLDELLYENPCEPPTSDFVDRIKANIDLHRQRRQRVRFVIRASWGALALIGASLILANFYELMALVPSLSVQGIGSWIQLAIESPTHASLDFLQSIESWAGYHIPKIEWFMILAIILLALPATVSLDAILSRKKRSEGKVQ